jgi:hypothetical protein
MFFVGAATIVNYWIATREKWFVSRVRSVIVNLVEYHQRWDPSEKATYEEILALRRWADPISYDFYPWSERIRQKLGMPRRKLGIDDAYAAFAHDRDRGLLYSEVIVAEAIICEKVFGLSRDDGLRLLRSAKTLEDLGPLTLTASCKKAFLDHIDKVVWPPLDKYFRAENALSSVTRRYEEWAHLDAVEDGADIEAARQRVEKHRQRVLLAACQATDELHHLADFAKKDALAAQLFAQFKDVHSAIEAKCNPAEDLNLLRDVADAFLIPMGRAQPSWPRPAWHRSA